MKGCMTVSIIEDAHGAAPSMVTTGSTSAVSADGRRSASERGSSAPWKGAAERKRASSNESWFQKTLRSQDPEKVARRESRRARRRQFFRKLFGRSPSEDEEDDEDEEEEFDPSQGRRKSAAALGRSAMAPDDEGSKRRLNDLYYASIKTIMDQYTSDRLSDNEKQPQEDGEQEEDDDNDKYHGKDYDASDLDSNTDMSEISVFDLEEDDDEDEDDYDSDDNVNKDYALVPIDETELMSTSPPKPVFVHDVVREMPMYVAPPVRVPIEYTLQDRRGGTLVGGRHVLFTSAAFKRKQRQFLYTLRKIPEDDQYVVPQVGDDDSDDELITDGVYAPESNWV